LHRELKVREVGRSRATFRSPPARRTADERHPTHPSAAPLARLAALIARG